MASSEEAKQQMRLRRLPVMCQKTKICRYHAWGMCARGAQCGFAHGESELQPVPDLSRTKPCPSLVNIGICEDPQCTFAHDKEELRQFPLSMSRSRDKTAERAFEVAHSARMSGMGGTGVMGCPRFGNAYGRFDEDASTRASDTEGMTSAAVSWLGAASAELGTASFSGTIPVTMDVFSPMARPVPSPQTVQARNNDALSHERGDAPSNPASAVAPRSKFDKTKLCTFFFTGKCKKRGRCAFAHSQEELRPLPDLSFTKMCPTLLEGGHCSDPQCTFAHCQEELREDAAEAEKAASRQWEQQQQRQQQDPQKEEQQQQQRPQTKQTTVVDDTGSVNTDDINDDINGDDNSDPDIEMPSSGWRRQQTEDPVAMRVRMMRVKNTFITIEEEEENEQEGEKPHRKLIRSSSAPALLRPDVARGPPKIDSRQHTGNSRQQTFGSRLSVESRQQTFEARQQTGESWYPWERHDARPQPAALEAAMPPRNFQQLQVPCQPAARLPRPPSKVTGSLQPVLEVPSLARPSLSQGSPLGQAGEFSRFPGRAVVPEVPQHGREPSHLREPLFIQPSWGLPSMPSPVQQKAQVPEMKRMWQPFPSFPGGFSPMAHMTPIQAMMMPAIGQGMANGRY